MTMVPGAGSGIAFATWSLGVSEGDQTPKERVSTPKLQYSPQRKQWRRTGTGSGVAFAAGSLGVSEKEEVISNE